MLKHSCRRWWSIAVVALLCWATPTWSWGAESKTVEAPADERAAVRRGVELERESRWLDAIEGYELWLKDWPNSDALQYGLRRAKTHFSIERRYADRSFNEELLVLSQREAFEHVTDVLDKIRQHYVDPVSETVFVAHGTESLYFALNNPKFLDRNCPTVSKEELQAVRNLLKKEYWNRRVLGSAGVQQTVFEISAMCQRELNCPPTAVVLEYAFGGCNALDDYSSYLTPSKLEDLYSGIEGEFVGIGIEMKSEQGKGLLLVNVLPESPAEEGGALMGDFISAINGIDCRTMSTEEAAGLLQGAPGSQVKLELTDSESGATRHATLTRRAVKVKSIAKAEIVDFEQGIGYIKMTGFQKNTAQELDAALMQLHREGMRALIWDLRGNPGGLLTAAVEVLDRFVDDGVLVSTRGRISEQNWSYSAQQPGTWSIPLVLLVDGDSASASEIVAGAVHDLNRGTVVGRKTYGKWSVQSILPGRGNSGMRLTTAKFYSPNGKTYGKIGLEPDVAVAPWKPSGHQTGFRGVKSVQDDRDVQTGIEQLRQKLARR
jgi:carboxyl-terminal processing protease